MWYGHIDNHKWSYGRSGSDVSRGESVRLWQNYDAGWLGASAMYRYMEGKGWECVQQNIANLQVGQPHCIVGQMYGYRDTWGRGGEYWQYRNKGGDMEWGDRADSYSGRNIRIMEQGGRNHLAKSGRWTGKNKYKSSPKEVSTNTTTTGHSSGIEVMKWTLSVQRLSGGIQRRTHGPSHDSILITKHPSVSVVGLHFTSDSLVN